MSVSRMGRWVDDLLPRMYGTPCGSKIKFVNVNLRPVYYYADIYVCVYSHAISAYTDMLCLHLQVLGSHLRT